MRVVRRTITFSFLTLFFLLNVSAQITSQTGALTGRVTDSTGAVIPNAKVTITSAQGAIQTKNSNETGDFTFPLLTPGNYQLTVEMVGFNKKTVNAVRVQVTDTTNVPVQLEVGTETTEISVQAEVTQVNVTNATLGNVLPGSTLDKLPLATRNFTNLLAFNAGTASAVPDASLVGRGSTTVFVNGQRGTMNNLVINGIDSNNLGSNNFASVPVPSPDSIEEFRVQTSMYDASQGKTSGGNVNVLTKGGGPNYHGQLYEFFRNEKLNANNFFFNRQGVQRPLLRQNIFGGSFGGPVPKTDKLFFFGSYQGTRQSNGLSGAIVTLFPVLPEQRTAANLASAFGLNPSQVDPTALALLNQKGQFDGWLIPSGKGAAPGQAGNIAYSAPVKFNDDQFNGNGDWLATDRHRLALRYFQARAKTIDPFGGQGAGNLGNGQEGPINNYLASISETWTVTPSAINEFRLGFNRIQTGITSKEPVSLSAVGMQRYNSALYPGIPFLFTNEYGPGYGGISTNFDQAGFSNTVHLSDTFAVTKGKHSMRFGFEMRYYQINLFNNFASRGFLSFQTFKDFVQGNILQAFTGTGQTYRDFRAKDISWYVQDDYKLTRRLTLNLGVRYDYLGPSTDRRNRVGNFDPNLLDAATLATGGAGLRNGFILPANADFGTIKGTPGVSSSSLSEGNKMNFSPRVGMAWDVFGNGKTSVRAGYGMYYVRISNQMLLQLLTAAPFFQQSSVVAPGTPLSNPFPALPVPSQFPIFPTLPSLTGYNAAGTPTFSSALLALNPIQRNIRTPYAQHYNFSIQQQLPWKMYMEVGYIGSQGVRLLQSLQVNQALLANDQAPIRGLTANSVRNVQSRVGTVGFSATGLNMVTDNGHSSYNAAIVTLNRRVDRMFIQGSYTLAKSVDNNSGSAAQDLGNSGGNQLVPALQRGLSDFDRRHRLQVTYNYDLPGMGTGFLKQVFGNWSIGGTTIFQSSLPINFTCATCAGANVYGQSTTLYPQLVGDFKNIYKIGDPRQYLDAGTSVWNTGILAATPTLTQGQAFGNVNAQGGPGTQTYTVGGAPGTIGHTAQLFGTMVRNPGSRGPFQQQWDFYVGKSFPIHENLRLNFRSEFFNLFNHPFFTNPNAVFGGATFGRYTTQSNAPRIIQFALKLEF